MEHFNEQVNIRPIIFRIGRCGMNSRTSNGEVKILVEIFYNTNNVYTMDVRMHGDNKLSKN